MKDWDSLAMEQVRNYPDGTWMGMEMARWQRAQLRTDEAVERVAQSLFRRVSGTGRGAVDWEQLTGRARNDYRADARAALTALLGPEPHTAMEGGEHYG